MENFKPSGRSGYIRKKKMGRKKCSKCQTEKFLNQFSKGKQYTLGVVSICKICFYALYQSGKKTNMRPCIGIYCRGERLFKSFNGHRICPQCRAAIRNMEDGASHSPLHIRRKGAVG